MSGIELNGLLGFLHLVLVIWAILNIAQARETTLAKALWIALVIVLPLIGFLIWLFLGPRARGHHARRYHRY